MRIYVFSLAKQLQIETKQLLDLCEFAEIPVKRSALAKITPEQQDQILKLIQAHPYLIKQKPAPTARVRKRMSKFPEQCEQTQSKLLPGICPQCGTEIIANEYPRIHSRQLASFAGNPPIPLRSPRPLR